MLTSDVFDAVAGDDEAGKSVAANWFRREDMLEGGGRQSAKAIFDLTSLKIYLACKIYPSKLVVFVQITKCI